MVARFETGKPKVIIPAHLCAEEGRVLCSYGDAGWGREVARGKYETRGFSDALVTAAADLILAKWKPEPGLRWVTAVPSQRHPMLVWDFAQRVAERLGLPLKQVLRKRRETRPQKEMQNSAMQLHNLMKAFEVISPQPVPMPAEQQPNGFTSMVRRLSQEVASVIAQPPILDPGPVLLVDDVADSRWTLTLAAVLLRLHGSGPVFPFALARASLRGG
jgi:ATP-dependent DNA helicase RecQ